MKIPRERPEWRARFETIFRKSEGFTESWVKALKPHEERFKKLLSDLYQSRGQVLRNSWLEILALIVIGFVPLSSIAVLKGYTTFDDWNDYVFIATLAIIVELLSVNRKKPWAIKGMSSKESQRVKAPQEKLLSGRGIYFSIPLRWQEL